MKLLIKKVFLLGMLSCILVAFSIVSENLVKYNMESLHSSDDTSNNLREKDISTMKAKDYYLENTFEETGSKNIVTGIYLDYRLFDSIFESSILLITATGIIFISKNDEATH